MIPRRDERSTAADSSLEPWAVLGVTSLPIFAVALDTTVLYVAFDALRRTFVTSSAAELSWALNAYTIVSGALLVAAGRVADRVGRRRAFITGLVLFTVASALCGLAPSARLLILARVIQAMGAAILLPTSLALILSIFPREKRPIAVSIWAAVQALAAAIGPALGSAIVQTVGWRYAFFINIPIGGVALLRARTALTESRANDASPMPRPWPLALAVAAPGLFALGIIGAGKWGPASRATLGCLAAALVLSALLVVDTRRSAAPIVDPALFRDRNYRLALWAMLAFSASFSAMFFGLILFLTRVWDYSIMRAGLAMSPGPLSVMPVAILAGRVAAKHGHRPLLVVGGAAYALAAAALLLWGTSTPAYVRLFLPASLFFGCAIGLVLPSLSGVAVHGLSKDHFALGVAVNSAVRQLGSVLGVAFVVGFAARDQGGLVAGFRDVLLLLIAGGSVTAWIGAHVDTRPAAALHPRPAAVGRRLDLRDTE